MRTGSRLASTRQLMRIETNGRWLGICLIRLLFILRHGERLDKLWALSMIGTKSMNTDWSFCKLLDAVYFIEQEMVRMRIHNRIVPMRLSLKFSVKAAE